MYEYVSRQTQKESAEFLNKQIFTTPTWLINKEICYKTGVNTTAAILSLQEAALNRMMSVATMNKLLNAEAALGKEAYTLLDMLGDLKQMLFTELGGKKPVELYRRNLQKAYVEKLGTIINPPLSANIFILRDGNAEPVVDSKKSDIISFVKGHARELKAMVDAAAGASADRATKYHLQDLGDRLKKMLDPK